MGAVYWGVKPIHNTYRKCNNYANFISPITQNLQFTYLSVNE